MKFLLERYISSIFRLLTHGGQREHEEDREPENLICGSFCKLGAIGGF
jgi:hypothetical protein